MAQKLKILIAVVLVAVAAIAIGFSTKNGGLFKGQLMGQNQQPGQVAVVEETAAKADLYAKMDLVMPTKDKKDIEAVCTITNLGPGSIDGKTPFKYAVYVNGKESFSNVDSYTKMEASDSFSFSYIIPRDKTPNTGKIKFVVDTENNIKEDNKNNNSAEMDYTLQP